MKRIYLLFMGLSILMLLQAQSVNVTTTPGNLEGDVIDLGENPVAITELTISGSIDARDFGAMRDFMVSLTTIDMSDVSIAAYTGTLGTIYDENRTYSAGEVPMYAFQSRASLEKVSLPTNIISIDDGVFYNCTGLDSIIVGNASPLDLSSSPYVFQNIDPSCVLCVPCGSKLDYESMDQWNALTVYDTGCTVGVDETIDSFCCFVKGGKLYVNDIQQGQSISVYDIQGSVIYRNITLSEAEIDLPAKGVYIVKVGDVAKKIVY